MQEYIKHLLLSFTGDGVNALAIIVGSVIGVMLKGGIKEKYSVIITQAIGLSVMLVGLSGTVSELIKPHAGTMLFIISLVIGGLIGEWINIEGRLEQLAQRMQNRFKSGGVKEGFVTATLIYCVGSMAILGAIKSGVAGDHSILFTKSILDGVISIILATTMGIGVILSSVSVFLYQGVFVLLSTALQPIITDVILSEISLVGGILIMVIGLNMLNITKIKVGNFLPAIFIPIVYYSLIMPVIHLIFG